MVVEGFCLEMFSEKSAYGRLSSINLSPGLMAVNFIIYYYFFELQMGFCPVVVVIQ
jgi:hypothetical protein